MSIREGENTHVVFTVPLECHPKGDDVGSAGSVSTWKPCVKISSCIGSTRYYKIRIRLPSQIESKEHTHGSLGHEVGNGNEGTRVSVYECLKPSARGFILNLDYVREHCCAAGRREELDCWWVSVEGACERILGDRNCGLH